MNSKALWMGLVGLLVVGPTPVVAQPRGRDRTLQNTSEIVEAPRDLRRLIDEAERAIQKSQWAEASIALGTALGIEASEAARRSSPDDYFLAPKTANEYQSSLRGKARLMIEQMPADGQKMVELRYGVTARQRLEEAVAKGDWAAIAQVHGALGFTEAGRDAGWLLAERKLTMGDAFGAAATLDRLMDSPAARSQLGPALGWWSALAWRILGQEGLAQERLKSSRELWPNGSVAWNGRTVRYDEPEDLFLAAFKDIDLRGVVAQPNRLDQWWLPGGRPDNNGHGFVGLTMRIVSWDLSMHESRQHESAVLQTLRQRAGNEHILPARVPLVVDPWVIVKTYDQRVQAVHQKTGKIIWMGPQGGMPMRWGQSRSGAWDQQGADHLAPEYLANEVWGDYLGGQLSSDGQHVFEICDISALEVPQNLIAGAPVVIRTNRTKANVLRAFSLADEGKLIWEVGGATGLSEPKLAGAWFLGTPVAAQGNLYALAELNGEVKLVALESNQGKMIWSQQLAANIVRAIADDNARRPLAARPAVASDLIICPTLSGCLVAFDATTRSLRWAYRYSPSTTGMSPSPNIMAMDTTSFDIYAPRSCESSVLIAEGLAFHMPPDAAREREVFFAIDLATGKPKWPRPLPRDGARYFGGVWNGKLLVVGDKGVRAYHVQTGQPAWKNPIQFATGDRLAGRGARNGNRYFVPLASHEILEIDIDLGQAVSKSRVEEYPGNLVATRNSLISMGPLHLSSYSLRDTLAREIDLEFLKDPTSPSALKKKSEVLMADGDIEGALDAITRAYRAEPNNADYQILMMKVGTAALQSDFQKFSERIREFESLLSIGPERKWYLISLIQGYQQQGKLAEAFEKLIELSELRTRNRPSVTGNRESIELEKQLSVDEDRWIATQAERLYERADPATQSAIGQLLQGKLERAARAVLPFRDEQLAHFWNLPMTAPLRLGMAREWILAGEFRRAENLAISLLPRHRETKSEWAEPAVDLLVEIYRKSGNFSSAALVASRYGRPMDWVQEPKAPSRASLDRVVNPDLLAAGMRASQWPDGMVYWSGDPPLRNRFSGGARPSNWEIRLHEGHALEDFSAAFSPPQAMSLLDPWGQEMQPYAVSIGGPNQDVPAIVHAVHSTMVIEARGQLIVLSLLDHQRDGQGQLWRQQFASGLPTLDGLNRQDEWGMDALRIGTDYSLLHVSSQGLIVHSGTEVSCLDLQSKQVLWSRSGVGAKVEAAVDYPKLALLQPQLGTRTVVDIRDGSIIEQNNWTPDSLEPRFSSGRYVLSTDRMRRGSDRSLRLRMWDGLDDKVLLEQSIPEGTKGSVVEGRYFVAVEPTGKTTYVDLPRGQFWSHLLEKTNNLSSIRAVRHADQILLLPYSTQYFPAADIKPAKSNASVCIVAGRMMALRRDDGQPLWNRSIQTFKFHYPLFQPKRSPAILLARSIQGTGQKFASVAVVDIRDGHTVFQVDDMPLSTGVEDFDARITPSQQRVQMIFAGNTIALQWTNEERPPEGISNLGQLR